MRITFVIGSLARGGAERVVSILASNLADKQNDVEIVLIASSSIKYELSSKVRIVDCTKRSPMKGLSFLKRISCIRTEINNFNPDVVISFTVGVNIYSILSCLFSKYKLIICERNDPRYDPNDKYSRLLRYVLYRYADGYVFQTTGERDFFSKNIQEKSDIIPNPLSSSLPEPYNGVKVKKIVSVARLQTQKNYPLAIRAFHHFLKTHEDYIYEIYGDGPLHSELIELTKTLKIQDHVYFMGEVGGIFEKIMDASAFLLSSDYEGLSNSMLEALALGIPTVSTDYPSGGARDFITNGTNGILVPVNSEKEMADALNRIIDEQDFSNKATEYASIIREKLSIDRITQEWEAYIRKIALK